LKSQGKQLFSRCSKVHLRESKVLDTVASQI
jgi:hypothetical protein